MQNRQLGYCAEIEVADLLTGGLETTEAAAWSSEIKAILTGKGGDFRTGWSNNHGDTLIKTIEQALVEKRDPNFNSLLLK